jgi:hypothetical protein
MLTADVIEVLNYAAELPVVFIALHICILDNLLVNHDLLVSFVGDAICKLIEKLALDFEHALVDNYHSINVASYRRLG